jgi:hypothetical protein
MMIPRRLPGTSETTEDENKYVDAWEELALPIAEITGATVHAFDPDIQYNYNEISVNLPCSFVKKINSHLTDKNLILMGKLIEGKTAKLDKLVRQVALINESTESADLLAMAEQAKNILGE